MKVKFKMMPEALEFLRKKHDDKLIHFELTQKARGQIVGGLKNPEWDFSENMELIRNVTEEIQDFTNKLGRRVL